MRRVGFIVWLAVGMLLAGCGKKPEAAGPEPVFPGAPTQAQPKLRTMKLYVGASEVMTAELALSEKEKATGMMFRTNMAENESMLFVLDHPMQASFWMLNCPLPLSAAYIDPDGVILEIHPLQPNDTNSVTAVSHNVQYVLETRQGWFDRHHVTPGMALGTDRGSLKKTFFGER